jgi:hypothetical protein
VSLRFRFFIFSKRIAQQPINAAGGFAYALAVLGLRWRRASSEMIVCAAVLDTFFSSLGYELEKNVAYRHR